MTSNRFLGGVAAAFAFTAFAALPALAQKAPPAAPTATKPKATKTAASPCKGLAQAACGANKACAWIQPKKKTDTRGRALKPYCRKVAGVAKKK